VAKQCKKTAKASNDYQKLTPKRKRFVDEYCIDFNGTQAAIRAGYSSKTANEQAARLLAIVSVKKAVEERKSKIAEKNQLKVADVINELKKIGFSDITQVVDWNNLNLTFKNSSDLPADAKGAIASISETPNGGKVIKLHDKVKALELLGRYLNMFTDKLQVDSSGVNLVLNMSGKKE